VGEESLFYRPKNPLLSTIRTYLGGPTPSRRHDPAIRFDRNGVEHQVSYGRGPTTRLGWKEVRAVAMVPGPVPDRQGLCVYPFEELPEPDVAVSELWTGAGQGSQSASRSCSAHRSRCIGITCEVRPWGNSPGACQPGPRVGSRYLTVSLAEPVQRAPRPVRHAAGRGLDRRGTRSRRCVVLVGRPGPVVRRSTGRAGRASDSPQQRFAGPACGRPR